MKEYNRRASLIDDDEEGGDEPDLIANHELNDIGFLPHMNPSSMSKMLP